MYKFTDTGVLSYMYRRSTFTFYRMPVLHHLNKCYLEVSAKDDKTSNLYSHLINCHRNSQEVSEDVQPTTSLQSKLPQIFKAAQ